MKSVTSCTGDATVACIRGRVKHGFDYEVQLTWSYSVGGREVTGLLQLDVSRTAVCDEEVQYSSSYDKAKSGLKATVKPGRNAGPEFRFELKGDFKGG